MMNIKITTIMILCLISLATICKSKTVNAIEAIESSKAISTSYIIRKSTISNGGGVITSSSGNYRITSAIGQIDAGHNTNTSGVSFIFNGGFLVSQTSQSASIFKNGFE